MDLETTRSQCFNKEMAYLFGVYLTDGHISNENKFSLQVIDKDFAENTLRCIKKIKPDCSANIYTRENPKGKWNVHQQFCINAGFTEWKEFFENSTSNKKHIPALIWDAPKIIKKYFVAGIMDGDGYITYKKHLEGRIQVTIGVGKTEGTWIHDFRELLIKLGVRVNKVVRDISGKYNVPFISFTINVQDFISNGLFFTIARKQNRVEMLKKVQRLNIANPEVAGLRNSPNYVEIRRDKSPS